MHTKQITIGVIVLIMAAAGTYYLAGGGRERLPQGGAPMGKQVPGPENANGPITGVWRSDEDGRFTRELRADGVIVDRYAGDEGATATGSWQFVEPTQEELPMPADAFAGMRMIRAVFQDGETMRFAVAHLTETSLELINVDGRGNVLSFTKDMR